jgi:hypothetical protein
MNRQPLKSSHLASAGYDPRSKTIEVEFRNGDVYQYSQMEPAFWEGLVGSRRPGKFFHQHVRRVPEFRVRKIERP